MQTVYQRFCTSQGGNTMATEAVNNLEHSKRKAGILLHPTSFPSPYGIGDLGEGAYRFIDFLKASGQKLWQVLPIGPTGYGDSPYQSFSSFAGQPLIISPQKLYDMGLLTMSDLAEIPEWEAHSIDFGPLIEYKYSLYKKAYALFLDLDKESPIYKAFSAFVTTEDHWLVEYALFMAVKDAHQGVMWTEWSKDIAFPTEKDIAAWTKKLETDVNYYKFLQFLFYDQWFALKTYANDKGIQIIGDTPIFVAFDSADVWANKELFHLDTKGYPTFVAGVPPDYFSETGQLWGNPLYNWAKHKETGYAWWIKKVDYTLKLVDILRIDHFRGFEAYWAIPYGAPNAIEGEWRKGPFKDLFYAFESALGQNLPIIAEDLGVITPAVEDLRDSFHLPGMKILQFAFESLEENGFLPHHYIPNSVCYTGTHDNDTTLGWYNNATEESRDKVRRYMNTDGNDVVWDFIRICFGSVSEMAIIPLQDAFSLDTRGRMNVPGVAGGNWQWRYTQEMLSDGLIQRLRSVTELYGRI